MKPDIEAMRNRARERYRERKAALAAAEGGEVRLLGIAVFCLCLAVILIHFRVCALEKK